MSLIRLALPILLASLTWTARLGAQSPAPEYLYLWTASEDSTQPDFLAVLDVTEDSTRYGRLVTTLPVPGLGTGRTIPSTSCRPTGSCSRTATARDRRSSSI